MFMIYFVHTNSPTYKILGGSW